MMLAIGLFGLLIDLVASSGIVVLVTGDKHLALAVAVIVGYQFWSNWSLGRNIRDYATLSLLGELVKAKDNKNG